MLLRDKIKQRENSGLSGLDIGGGVDENNYILGIDVGQSRDYTAICVLEPIETKDGYKYHCTYIKRLPLNKTFSDMALDVKSMVEQLEVTGHVSVIIDKTGVGAPVVELVDSLTTCEVIGLTITAGIRAKNWNVPKKELITNLQIALQSQTLKIAKGLDFGEELVEELLNYQVKTKPNNNEIFDTGRVFIHDDLILSLAIGLYLITNRYPQQIQIESLPVIFNS